MKYFCIGAIFKQEEPYIGDWIKYHLGIGAEHIWLYDNDSYDNSAEIAREAGGDRVTITAIHGHPKQKDAYLDCINIAAGKTFWLSFLDIDEYLVSYTPIHTLLKEFEDYPALCPHWILFGSNGHEKAGPEPVPVRFTRCQADVNPHVKTICQPTRTGAWITAHRFIHDQLPVDENKKPIPLLDSTPDGGTADRIYVAHFTTKSKAECYERRSRPRPDTGEYRYNVPEFFAAHDRNERENLDVLRLWDRVCGTDACYYDWSVGR